MKQHVWEVSAALIMPAKPGIAVVLALLGAVLCALVLWPAAALAPVAVWLLRVVLMLGGVLFTVVGAHGIWKALS